MRADAPATVEELVARGLAAEAKQEPAEALEFFRQALALSPDDAFLNHKVARQLFDQTFLVDTDEERRTLVEEALGFAQRSVELDPKSAPNVLSLAVLYGHLGVYGDVRTKVDYARRIKRYAERALELDPDYAWAHVVLGRWHVEIHRLGFARRLAASLLYGGLPAGSLKTGTKHLERAVELEPDELVHQVELAYAYAAADRKDRAREIWTHVLETPSSSLYDGAAKYRARRGLRRLEREGASR